MCRRLPNSDVILFPAGFDINQEINAYFHDYTNMETGGGASQKFGSQQRLDETSEVESAQVDGKAEPAPQWRNKPMWARVLMIAGLLTAYSVVVITDAVYAHSIGIFVNISTSTLLHDVVPVQYIIILQTMVGVWQLFFLVYMSMATLTSIRMTEMPLPVIPLYTASLVINLFVTLAMYLGSDIMIILLTILIAGVLSVSVFLSIRATYNSPIPVLPLCAYNPQVLYATFMIYTSLYFICHYITTFGHDAHITNLILVAIFLAVIIILMAIDIIVLDKWMQRTWSPYISSIISTIYLTIHNWGKGDVSVYLFICCTVLLSIGWIIKLIRSAQLTFKKPCDKLMAKMRERKENRGVKHTDDDDDEVAQITEHELTPMPTVEV